VRDLVLEIAVGLALVLIGVAVVYLFIGDRARDMNLDLAYILGALVISVPAIVILEIRRRRRL
jgi:hypothetical protein